MGGVGQRSGRRWALRTGKKTLQDKFPQGLNKDNHAASPRRSQPGGSAARSVLALSYGGRC